MKISEILKKKSTISFEVFPPKNKNGDISSIYRTIEKLSALSPDFISVTYGAGGSTKGRTIEIASMIKHQYDMEAVAHLSCISSKKEDILWECERLKEESINPGGLAATSRSTKRTPRPLRRSFRSLAILRV